MILDPGDDTQAHEPAVEAVSGEPEAEMTSKLAEGGDANETRQNRRDDQRSESADVASGVGSSEPPPERYWEFDDGSRWELGDSMAGGAHKDSRVVNGKMVPGFITLRIISADGDEQEHRYALAPSDPVESEAGILVRVDAPPNMANSQLNGSLGMLVRLEGMYATVRLVTGNSAGREWQFLPNHLIGYHDHAALAPSDPVESETIGVGLFKSGIAVRTEQTGLRWRVVLDPLDTEDDALDLATWICDRLQDREDAADPVEGEPVAWEIQSRDPEQGWVRQYVTFDYEQAKRHDGWETSDPTFGKQEYRSLGLSYTRPSVEGEGAREAFYAGFDAATSDAGLGFYATETRERHYQTWLAALTSQAPAQGKEKP